MSQTNLVHVHHNKPFTDSLVIAEGVGLRHKKVIELIRKHEASFLEFGTLPFQRAKSGGLETVFAELNEDQATFLITLFRNNETVIKFKITLVKEFRKAINEISRLKNTLSDPNRNVVLIEKRKSGSAMTDGLQFVRELLGKETNSNHYGNEHLFCNRALTGKWGPLDESTLDAYDLRLLEKIRNHNTVLIALHPVQKDRKQLLDDFVSAYRIKHPRLQLV